MSREADNKVHNFEPTEAANGTLFEEVIPSTFGSVSDTLREVTKTLRLLGFSTEDCGSTELVLAEVLNNIVEHAYGEAVGPIDLRISTGAGGLFCVIRDRGVALPDGKMPMGQAMGDFTGLEDLPEGGFGWFLIRELARDLLYRRIGNENQFSFRIDVSLEGETV